MAGRKVTFYACQDVPKQPQFQRLGAVENIATLPDAKWRVSEPSLASDLAVIVDRVGTPSQSTRLRFLRIREGTPFKLSAARKLSPLEIEENEAITDFTWVVIWPDRYMAAVNDPNAPTHKKLARYFEQTSSEQTYIVNLLQPDVLKRLKELRKSGKLRQVQISARMSELEHAAEKQALPGLKSLLAAGREAEALTVNVTFGIGRGNAEERLSDQFAQTAEELAPLVSALESMNINGYDAQGNKHEINMKNERIWEQIEPTANTDAAIYAAIEKARKTVEAKIGSLGKAARGH